MGMLTACSGCLAQVKQIQEEYQAFMEGVRGRAQGAIDQANALFQAYRAEATSHLDAAIHYLQSRFFAFPVRARAHPPCLRLKSAHPSTPSLSHMTCPSCCHAHRADPPSCACGAHGSVSPAGVQACNLLVL